MLNKLMNEVTNESRRFGNHGKSGKIFDISPNVFSRKLYNNNKILSKSSNHEGIVFSPEQESIAIKEIFDQKNELKEVRKLVKNDKVISYFVVETSNENIQNYSENNKKIYSIKTMFKDIFVTIVKAISLYKSTEILANCVYDDKYIKNIFSEYKRSEIVHGDCNKIHF